MSSSTRKAAACVCAVAVAVLLGVFGGEFVSVLPATTGWRYADLAFALIVFVVIVVITALVIWIITIKDDLRETRQRGGSYIRELRARDSLYKIRGALLILFAHDSPEKDFSHVDAWIGGYVQAYGAKKIMTCATDSENPTLPGAEWLEGEAGKATRREIADWLSSHSVR